MSERCCYYAMKYKNEKIQDNVSKLDKIKF